MGTPFKMKGSPMQRNFPSAFKQNDDQTTRGDTVRAINMRHEYLKLDGKPEWKTDSEYEFISGGKKSREILNKTDVVTQDKNKTQQVLKEALKKSDAKRRRSELVKKAVKGTTKNTVGVLRDSKNKSKKKTLDTGFNI